MAAARGDERARPLVSIVLEGYNESRELGLATTTLDALAAQEFPLDQVEVLLVGRPEQVAEWVRGASEHPFAAVRAVPVEDAEAGYYGLKNAGAEAARGEIVAFTDSDVFPCPLWLASITEGIRRGADATAGPSLFKGRRVSETTLPRKIAASITWGWIVGPRTNGGPRARGFMDHNVAMRTSVLRDHGYRTDLGRILASPLLYRALVNDGRKVELQRDQQAIHHFGWRYWLTNLHLRYGYEVHRLRRLDSEYPNRWIARTWLLEPAVTMVWHMALDVPRWFRFGELVGLGRARLALLLPALVAMSAVARGAEMVGMCCTLVAPERMRRWAESV